MNKICSVKHRPSHRKVRIFCAVLHLKCRVIRFLCSIEPELSLYTKKNFPITHYRSATCDSKELSDQDPKFVPGNWKRRTKAWNWSP